MSRVARQGDLLLVYYAIQSGKYSDAESMLKAILENRPLHPLRYRPGKIKAKTDYCLGGPRCTAERCRCNEKDKPQGL